MLDGYQVLYYLSFLLGVSAFFPDALKKQYVTAFALLFIAGYITQPIEDFTLLIYAAILIAVFIPKQDAVTVVYSVIHSMTILWSAVMVAGAIVFIINPAFQDTMYFPPLISGIVIASSLCLHVLARKCKLFKMSATRQGKIYILSVELIILILFNVILPNFTVSTYRLYAVLQLTFVAVMIVFMLTLQKSNQLELANKKLLLEQREAKEMERQYKTVIELKHYYSRMFQIIATYIADEDVEGLKRYFGEYISPIHSKYIQEQETNQVKNELIRRLLEITIIRAVTDKIGFSCTLSNGIQIPQVYEFDVFRILTEWIDNAIDAIKGESDAYIHIEIRRLIGQYIFRVQNSLPAAEKKIPTYGRGFGLHIAKGIIEKNPMLESATTLTEGLDFQQKLILHLK